MKIKTTKVRAKDLKVGDLFSTYGAEYWDKALVGTEGQVGEKIYIRTEQTCPEVQRDVDLFKIEIIGDSNESADSNADIEQWLEDCIDYAKVRNSELNDWEKEFISSLEKQYAEKKSLTPKQIDKLKAIWDKI